ncbi:MAG: class I SAM-dependent methyltransferase [Clostridia bacterium]|nr:class I SAM-dependent methyltransferase [Clostridia bacterium]
MEQIFKQVEKNIDRLVENQVGWADPATREQLESARNGILQIPFYDRKVPQEWLGDVAGKRILCLAGAGGLQGPILAAAGAKVTVIDLSDKMLEKDRAIAKREKLAMELIKGNMCNLSCLEEGSFDLILNPPSLMYVPDPEVVFRECRRVLRPGGCIIIMAPAPVNYLCDYIEDETGGYYKAVNKMPYDSRDFDDSGWVEYGHTMETYLGGLVRSGFAITGYTECQMEDITELHFMVRATRM